MNPTPLLDMVDVMEPKPWRERIRDEDVLLEQLNRLASESAARRARALRDGLTELGTIAEVARDLGKSWQAVDQALRRDQRKKAPAEDASTTE